MKARRLQVAVVDDEAQVRKALDRLMRGAGFEVQTWNSGGDFLNSLAGKPVDCVVLDLHMPGLSGFDILVSLQTVDPQVPAVVITGHDTAEAEARALGAGAFAYLRKPVDCVVLDLHMPGLSGFDILVSLQAFDPQVPAVVITGHDTAEAEARALGAGAFAYLRKPVDGDELIRTITQAVALGD